MGVAVNARTGKAIELPGTVCCWNGAGESVIFRKNSRLLVLAGLINETGQYGAHFYELKNDRFVHIKTIPVKEEESGATSPASMPPPLTTTYSPPLTQPQEPSLPNEDKPPVGRDLVLSMAQIRYCVAEVVRMDGAKSAMNNHVDSDVDRFNAMVADYNSRCGSFRYRSGALESARREVEIYRSQLQSEGRHRFTRGWTSSAASVVPPAAKHSTSDESVLQSMLLDSLRLKPGTTERILDSGKAIVALANSGFVNLKPDARIDYSDYRFFKRPVYIFGQEIVVIDEEYFKEWVGCCVSPGVAITVKINADTSDLQNFARKNKCGIGRDGDMYYGPKLPNAPIGTYVTLSCKERDAL